MSKQRTITLSERRRVDYIWQLQSWLEDLPRDATFSIDSYSHDGQITINWQEKR